MRSIFTLFLLFCSVWGMAQDINFTQFTAMPLHLNPAFTGTTPSSRFSTIYRNQWANVPEAYGINMLSFDYNWDYYNSGLGVVIYNDRVNIHNTTSIGLTYSYTVPLSRRWIAKLGLQAGLGLRMLNTENLIFADQIATGTTAEVFASQSSKLFPDFGTGILFYNEKFWFGAGIFHLNKPLVILYSKDDRINIRFSGHLGAKLVFNPKTETYLSPALIFQKQGIFEQMDAGMNFHAGSIIVGVWYRGTPWAKSLSQGIKQDAIAGLIGLKIKNLRINYSYDYTLSSFLNSGGSHEISLTIAPSYDRRKKRGSAHIECPAF